MRDVRGFSLVELMIAIAIVAIIGSISLVAYRDYVDTAKRDLIRNRVETFRMFEENWRADNGTYVEGDYQPGGANDFADIGYSVPNDDDGVTIEVTACGDGIDECYKVTATDASGIVLVWENGTYTWVN